MPTTIQRTEHVSGAANFPAHRSAPFTGLPLTAPLRSAPLKSVFGPLRSHSAHMLCQRIDAFLSENDNESCAYYSNSSHFPLSNSCRNAHIILLLKRLIKLIVINNYSRYSVHFRALPLVYAPTGADVWLMCLLYTFVRKSVFFLCCP